MNAYVVLAAGEAVNELPWPNAAYGIVAVVVFLLLGMITYSYRNVANRHRHKTQNTDQSSSGHH